MNLMIQPNQICLIVKLYNNRPELLPDSNDFLGLSLDFAKGTHEMTRNKYVILRIFIIQQPFYDAYVYVKFRRIFTNAE